MKIIPELKKIAGLNDKISHLAKIASEKMDAEGLDLQNAYLISGCKAKGKHLYKDGHRLDNYGLTDDLYYCNQYTGYCEDDFYGTLYFKTDVPGQYVAVPFSM
jgi:hypothetical protein